jgi:Fe-S-cluster containining protein
MAKQTKQLSPKEVILRILEFADKTLERAITENNHKTSCVRGCDFCCHQPVFATPLEALAVYMAVEKMTDDELEALGQRIEAYLQIVDATPHMAEGIEATQMDLCGLGDAPNKDQFQALYGPACPFLVNKECSIYEFRPLMCREHTSLDDPAKCEKDEPFFGLPAALFNEVPLALCMDFVPDEMLFLPVWEYERAVEIALDMPPVDEAFLNQMLSWKAQALGME